MSASTTSTGTGATVSAQELLAGEQLERRLEELLDQERFVPAAPYVAAARVTDAMKRNPGDRIRADDSGVPE